MPYEFQWLVPKRVLFIRASGILTETELLQQEIQVAPFLAEAAPQHLHVLMNIAPGTKPPPFTSYSKIQWTKQADWFVVCGIENRFFRFVASLAGQIMKLRFRTADTLADGLQMLNTLDPTLPDLSTAAVEQNIPRH